MLKDECGWKDGDRSAVVLRTLKEMRMELRQQRPGNRMGNTEMVACHFLHRDCMDLGHPSRLPNGSLRSAWTGPGRDPQGFTHTRKMAGSVPAASLRLPLVGTVHFIDHEQMKFIC